MATQNPQQALDALQATLDKKGFPPAVLFHGREGYFRSQGLSLLLSALGERDLVQVDQSSGPDVLASLPMELKTPSLFGTGKLVVVRESLFQKGREARLEEALRGFLAQPPQGVHLAILKREKLATNSRLIKAVQAARGVVVPCRELYGTPFPGRKAWESELLVWLLDQAKRRGLRFPPETALFLVAVLGRSPGELAGFLDRLALFLREHPGKTIDRSLLQRLLGPGGESNQFELAEALLLGDLRLSLLRARAILHSGLTAQDGQRMDAERALPATLSWLHQACARCFQAHLLLGQGVARGEVENRLQVHSFFRTAFWREVDATTPAGLETLLRAVLSAHERLRSGSEEPGRVLDLLVLEALN